MSTIESERHLVPLSCSITITSCSAVVFKLVTSFSFASPLRGELFSFGPQRTALPSVFPTGFLAGQSSRQQDSCYRQPPFRRGFRLFARLFGETPPLVTKETLALVDRRLRSAAHVKTFCPCRIVHADRRVCQAADLMFVHRPPCIDFSCQ